MGEEATDGELLDKVASQLYDSGGDPIPMDLHSACAVGNYKCVQDWISTGAQLEGRNTAGWTPLMYASYVGHDTIVNLLLDAGVDPSYSTPGNLSPLMVAAGCGNESVCYFLIQAGAEINGRDSNGYTALIHGVRQGHQTVVQLLLEAGVDMELQDMDNGHTALMFAALEGDEIIVDVLLACGAEQWAKDLKGRTARYLAYQRHHVRTVTLLDNAQYMSRPMSETPTNALPEEYTEEQEDKEYEEMTDLFSGAKEMEAYQESQAVKKSIQNNLGRRGGPRWSLPHQYIADRRQLSKSDNTLLGLKRRNFKQAVSMPEQVAPPPEAMESPEPSPPCPKMEEFLESLGLGKYINDLADNEIDFQTLVNFTDEDLKRVGITRMGPRRKLTLAIAELKGGGTKESSGSVDVVEALPEKRQEARKESSPPKGKNRGKLMRQSSTDVAEAYREALKNIERLEEKLGKEHQLRKTADIFLLKLQTSRQEAVERVSAIRDLQTNISKHCKAVKSSHQKLSGEIDTLQNLTSTAVDAHQLKLLYSNLVSLKCRLGLELEALSRSITSEADNVNNLSLLLKSNS